MRRPVEFLNNAQPNRLGNPKVQRKAGNECFKNIGALIVEAASEGFDGNLSEMARAIGMPLRTLMSIKSGQSTSSKGTRMLLAILASNPNQASRICQSANLWVDANRLTLASRVGAQARPPVSWELEVRPLAVSWQGAKRLTDTVD
jgi:hypothetical protein